MRTHGDKDVRTLGASRAALVTEPLDDGLLIYNVDEHQVHALGPAAAALWQAAQDGMTEEALASRTGLPVGQTREIIDRLMALDLVTVVGRDATETRRQALRRVAKTAGVVVSAGALISSVAVPSAMASASTVTVCPGSTCTYQGGTAFEAGDTVCSADCSQTQGCTGYCEIITCTQNGDMFTCPGTCVTGTASNCSA
jgi:hypothetical protein